MKFAEIYLTFPKMPKAIRLESVVNIQNFCFNTIQSHYIIVGTSKYRKTLTPENFSGLHKNRLQKN